MFLQIKVFNLAWQLDRQKVFSVIKLHLIAKPITFLLVVIKQVSNCCKLPLKASQEDKQETEEATASNFFAYVLSELDGVFKLI